MPYAPKHNTAIARVTSARNIGTKPARESYLLSGIESTKYTVFEVVGFLKGKSDIRLFDLHQELKRRFWGRNFRTKGYSANTLGQVWERTHKHLG